MKTLYDKFVHYLYYVVMSTCMILSAIITIIGVCIMVGSIVERMGK